MATAAEISEYDTEELERQLSETRRELFNLRFQLATGQLDNFSRINHVRKDVARMMTELRIREIAEAEGLALEETPAHQAAARRRTEDTKLGRDKTTASERRAKAKAEAAEAADHAGHDHAGHDHPHGDVDDDEFAEELADDDGMAFPAGEVTDVVVEDTDADDTADDPDADEAADEAADPEETS